MSIPVDGRVIPIIRKDPDAIKLYGFDWSGWLTPPAQVQTSTWIVPAPLVKDAESNAAGVTMVRIAGGVEGTTYLVTNRIVTNEAVPQTEDRSFKVEIKTT